MGSRSRATVATSERAPCLCSRAVGSRSRATVAGVVEKRMAAMGGGGVALPRDRCARP